MCVCTSSPPSSSGGAAPKTGRRRLRLPKARESWMDGVVPQGAPPFLALFPSTPFPCGTNSRILLSPLSSSPSFLRRQRRAARFSLPSGFPVLPPPSPFPPRFNCQAKMDVVRAGTCVKQGHTHTTVSPSHFGAAIFSLLISCDVAQSGSYSGKLI